MSTKKGHSTQSLVNTYPLWSNIRLDEQSLGFQYLNTVGILLDDLRKQNIRLGDNLYLPTSIVSDIDTFYSVQLPRDYEFTKEDDDSTELLFTPPTVSGLVNSTNYNIAIADNNNIQGFWYDAVPTRIEIGSTISSEQHLVASGLVMYSPFSPIMASGILDVPNQLTVTISGGTTYLETTDNNQFNRAIVQIKGTTRAGLDVIEELLFIYDETQKTINEYSIIDQVNVYNIKETSEAFIKVMSADFNNTHYRFAYDLDDTITKEPMPLFWSLGTGVQDGQYTLDIVKYDVDQIELRIDGFIDKHPFLQLELVDQSLNRIKPLDLSVEPRSDNLWIVDSGTLYLYSAELPYPNTSQLYGKQYGSASVIEPSSYYALLGEDVKLDYLWKRPIQGMISHRISVQKPDGTKYSIEDRTEVSFHTDLSSWILGEPTYRQIRSSDIFTLNQYGDYIYTLEVQYSDDTQSIDKRIVSVLRKIPTAQYSLEDLGLTNIVGIDYDSEYKMWVLDGSGNRYEIKKHYDNMIIDFAKKIIYLRDNYTRVRVY